MQSVKDIKARIKSVSETAKITRAMELISASKMQKASVRYNDCQAYFVKVREIIGDIIHNAEPTDSPHPYLDGNRKGKKAYLIIGSDKGLSGDYNHALNEFAHSVIKEDAVIFCAGDIVYRSFVGHGDVRKISLEKGTLEEARIIATHIAEYYKNGEINEVDVIFTRLVTKSRQECTSIKLLPILKQDFEIRKENEYIKRLDFEPSPMSVFAIIVPQYIIGMIYGCITEAKYAEHLERMRAMNSATESAEELKESLQISYNKARQEKITTELTELSVSLLETE
ncbi:MAG: FoF1 ATP synthase subunit gamma [Christensenellales bacterium]